MELYLLNRFIDKLSKYEPSLIKLIIELLQYELFEFAIPLFRNISSCALSFNKLTLAKNSYLDLDILNIARIIKYVNPDSSVHNLIFKVTNLQLSSLVEYLYIFKHSRRESIRKHNECWESIYIDTLSNRNIILINHNMFYFNLMPEVDFSYEYFKMLLNVHMSLVFYYSRNCEYKHFRKYNEDEEKLIQKIKTDTQLINTLQITLT